MHTLTNRQKALSRRYRNPDTADQAAASACGLGRRFVRLAPMSLLMAMLLLLVGFSTATGYLVMERKVKLPKILIPLISSHAVDHGLSQPAGGGKAGQGTAPALEPSAELASSATSGPGPEAEVVQVGDGAKSRFAVSLGAYLGKRSFDDERQLAALYRLPFYVKISDERLPMTRLYLGTYPIPKATALLNKVRKVAPDAFLTTLGRGQMAAVYAGSFYYRVDSEKRQRLLAQRGLATKKVAVRETVAVYTGLVGDFENRRQAVDFIRRAGLLAPQSERPALLASK